MTITESLKWAAASLRSAGIAQPEREAASLMMFTLDRDRTFLIAHSEYELSSNESRLFESHISRRSSREPFQHIVGKQEFYGLDFEVSPDVLIPRPETEMLVETAIDLLRDIRDPFFCDIGTGSGCVAVSILHELKDSRALAVDISPRALKVAERNARTNGVLDRLDLISSDVFSAFGDLSFDVILSNPPYIPSNDIAKLQAEVREFDPLIALTDGGDGLSIIRKIVVDAIKFLKPGGSLLLEIGSGQAEFVGVMFDKAVWSEAIFLPDLQGIERVVKARINTVFD